jgi:hypothetical protein
MYTQFQNLASATGCRPLLDGTHVQVWVTPSLHLKMSAIPGADDGVTRSWKTIFKCELLIQCHIIFLIDHAAVPPTPGKIRGAIYKSFM